MLKRSKFRRNDEEYVMSKNRRMKASREIKENT